MAFRIKTNLLVLTCGYVPAREQFERVRCTVLDIAFPFYSLPIKSADANFQLQICEVTSI